MTPAYHHLHLDLATVPPIMKRSRHVLILVEDEQGRFVLGSKHIYPAGIVRLLGGGVEGDEPMKLAACRELEEELRVKVNHNQLTELATVEAEIASPSEPQPIHFVTGIFYAKLHSQEITAGDDVNDLAFLTQDEYQQLIQRYTQLSPELDADKGFAWDDYGKLYSPIHQIALDALIEQKKQPLS
jgi:8-oxo-dGTP pyrophosphatase MutT (NUDIX family)